MIVISSIPSEEFPEVDFEFADKFAHFLEYLVFGLLLLFAFKRKKVLLLGAAFALIDELHQLLIPSRECSGVDLAADLGALAVSLMVSIFISHLRRKRNL